MTSRNDESLANERRRTTREDAILDAARSCVLEYGVRRTTLAEIARRAGVSRPTVYRRWADTQSVLADLITREFRAAVSDVVPADIADTCGRARLVRGVVDAAALVRSHPLFVKIFRADADLLLTYITERLGRTQHEVREICAALIRDGQVDGSIRDGDPDQLATMLLLIVQSAVQSASIVSATLPSEALDAELTRAIDGYLASAGA